MPVNPSGDRPITGQSPGCSTVDYENAPKVIDLGHDRWAICDQTDFPLLVAYNWRAVRNRRSWYAVTEFTIHRKRHKLYMSRMVADTPDGCVCHHRNRNSLDNRLANLVNMQKKDHQFLHHNDNLLIKFETAPRGLASELVKTSPNVSNLTGEM